MIFQHTIDKVLSGEKTQTRRLCYIADDPTTILTNAVALIRTDYKIGDIAAVWRGKHKLYEVGKTYAVQRGRGVKAEGRIRITRIRREDVRDISYTDVRAEGFISYQHFIQTWCYMHDASACREADKLKGIHICDVARTRPHERYTAWALTFALVTDVSP